MLETTTTAVTLDDLMRLGSDARVEVVDGEIVNLPPTGFYHQLIAGNIFRILDAHVTPNQLGLMITDGLLFLLDKDSAGIKGARVPDVAYIRREDFLAEFDRDKPYPLAPTLAVEVMSPNDTTEETLRRVRDYLNAGTQAVWVVYPRQRELHAYRASAPDVVTTYRGDDLIDTTPLFVGLELKTSTLFALPGWMEQSAADE